VTDLRERSLRGLLVVLGVLGGAGACDDDDPGPPLFPADYAATYAEVRDCRRSIDHDSQYIRVLAAPDALAPYRDRVVPFPTGAVVLKAQYEDDDDACAGAILQYTVMARLDDGADPDRLDWAWQRVTADREVVADEPTERCAACHASCQAGGYDHTCAEP
jgi:hypothetical protein